MEEERLLTNGKPASDENVPARSMHFYCLCEDFEINTVLERGVSHRDMVFLSHHCKESAGEEGTYL